jgi:hypothetical protein
MHALRADFRGQLARLNRELLFAYLDLVDCLVERPSAYARAVENVGLLARNMAYLLNALRAHQARSACLLCRCNLCSPKNQGEIDMASVQGVVCVLGCAGAGHPGAHHARRDCRQAGSHSGVQVLPCINA